MEEILLFMTDREQRVKDPVSPSTSRSPLVTYFLERGFTF
jgi:hypothetical protein